MKVNVDFNLCVEHGPTLCLCELIAILLVSNVLINIQTYFKNLTCASYHYLSNIISLIAVNTEDGETFLIRCKVDLCHKQSLFSLLTSVVGTRGSKRSWRFGADLLTLMPAIGHKTPLMIIIAPASTTVTSQSNISLG